VNGRWQSGRAGARALRGCLGLLGLLLVSGSAPAQNSDTVPTDGRLARATGPRSPLLYADFGWSGTPVAERWSPITVWIDPGDKPLEGVVVCEFPQDAAQAMRVAVPFVATPGTQLPVELVAALPNRCDRVDVALYSRAGKRLGALEYRNAPVRDQLQLPAMAGPGTALVVGVGDTSINDAARQWASPRQLNFGGPPGAGAPTDAGPLGVVPAAPAGADSAPPDEAGVKKGTLSIEHRRRLAWGRVRALKIAPDRLPVSWTAYDSLSVLVVQGEAAAKADPRGLLAVQEWVRAGGRLVILAPTAGPVWRQWLPPGPAGDLVEAGEVERLGVPAAVVMAVTGAGLTDDSGVAPVPASTAGQRTLRLTERGRAEGWTVRWPASGREDGGSLAEGPCGLGWVTVLGFDPRSATVANTTVATTAAWEEALEGSMGDWLDAASRDDTQRNAWWFATEPDSYSAIRAGLDRIVRTPELGDTVYWLILGGALLFAALVGPVDYLVLSRLRLSHRSWLTALGWIALASFLAYAGPRVVRATATTVSRLTVIDTVMPPLVGGEPAERPVVAQTALTAVFAGHTGEFRPSAGFASAFVRGVSSVFFFGASAPSATISTTQGPGTADADGRRASIVDSLPMSIWTLRTLLDETLPPPEVTARIEPEAGGDGWTLTVRGVPAGSRVAQGACQMGDRWYKLTFAERPGPAGLMLTAAIARGAARLERPAEWAPAAMADLSYPGMRVPGALSEARPGLSLSLPGSARRTRSITARVDGDGVDGAGRWACVYLEVEGLPGDVIVPGAEPSRLAIVRLLAPLPASEDKGRGDEGGAR
jgi:hypothetical protein